MIYIQLQKITVLVWIWLGGYSGDEIFEKVHLNLEFYDKLLGLIEKDQWPELNMALNLFKISSIPFWNSIYTYCGSEIYGIAVVTASKFYSSHCFKALHRLEQ